MGFHMAHNAASKAADAFAKVANNFNIKELLVGICMSTCKERVLLLLLLFISWIWFSKSYLH